MLGLFEFFDCFSTGLSVSLLLIRRISLHIQDVSTLSDIHVADIFSHSVNLIFHSLNGHFWGSHTHSWGWTSANSNRENRIPASQLVAKNKEHCVALGVTGLLWTLLSLGFLTCKWGSLRSPRWLFRSEISFFRGMRMTTWDGELRQGTEQSRAEVGGRWLWSAKSQNGEREKWIVRSSVGVRQTHVTLSKPFPWACFLVRATRLPS